MNSLIYPRTPLGGGFASNIPRRSSPALGRKKAFEGVIKAVTARTVAISLKARTVDQNKPEGRTPTRSAALADQKSTEGLTLLTTVPEQNEDGNNENFDISPSQFTTVIDNNFVPAPKSQPLPKRKVSPGEENTPQAIIYSTSSSVTSTSSASSDSDSSSLANVSIIPSSGLSEEEELEVVGVGAFFGEEQGGVEAKDEGQLTYVRWAIPIPTPTFLPEPSKSEIKIEYIEKLNEEDMTEQPPPIQQFVRRKPVPTDVPSSLMSSSREALISKVAATRPITTSLLSFTEDTSPHERQRQHPERLWRTRNATPDSDILRKACIERRRLVRAGLLLPLPSTPLPSPPKYFLYPRAGDLRALRSDESTACAEDFYLSYVDLSFIRKTLFAFDMRMRTGSDLWGDEIEEIYRWFGRDGEWEVDWDTRWRVAAWLLNQSDDEDGDAAEVESERGVNYFIPL
jgi:hypothetical protein